ncbi:hypothetical protein HNQ56_000642 [Anaerotaenia torta]
MEGEDRTVVNALLGVPVDTVKGLMAAAAASPAAEVLVSTFLDYHFKQ